VTGVLVKNVAVVAAQRKRDFPRRTDDSLVRRSLGRRACPAAVRRYMIGQCVRITLADTPWPAPLLRPSPTWNEGRSAQPKTARCRPILGRKANIEVIGAFRLRASSIR
jgi:hypothetical protein